MKIREIELEIIGLDAQADACLSSASDMLNRASMLREKANKLRDELSASIVEERTRHNNKKRKGRKE